MKTPRTAFRFAVISLLAALSGPPARAETQVLWALSGGGEGNDKIRGMAAAPDGGLFITGEISGATDLGDITLESAGQLDIVVAKLSAKGEPVWAVRAGGDKIDRGYGVSPAPDGGCYVTGHFQSGTIRFGEHELINAGDYDGFLARFDAGGACLWAKRFGGAAYDYGHGVATDSAGCAVMAGTLAGAGTLEDSAVGDAKGRNALLAKFAPDGKTVWVTVATGAGISGHNVAIGPDDAAYLCGFVRGPTRFGGEPAKDFPVQEAFVARHTSGGGFEWARHLGGKSNGLATSVVVDAEGRVYAAGMFQGEVSMGKTRFKSLGEHDVWIAGFSDLGDPLWLRRIGGPGIDYGLGLTPMRNGGCALTGEIAESADLGGKTVASAVARAAFVAVFSPAGDFAAASPLGGKDNDLSYAIAATLDGALNLAGAFRNETTLGRHSLKSGGGNDLFVCRLLP
ncbi:MAG: hypothetical protein KDM91_11775 [Verrucomicrobiae bacterium]|nr:hypothetical protein [Verrucomicrobiae bacterium]